MAFNILNALYDGFSSGNIVSEQSYYETLRDFVFDSNKIMLNCSREGWDDHRSEIFFKCCCSQKGVSCSQKGVIRNLTTNSDGVLKESLLLKTYVLSESEQRLFCDKEKDRYMRSNLKLVAERLIFDEEILELIAVKEDLTRGVVDDLINNFDDFDPPLGSTKYDFDINIDEFDELNDLEEPSDDLLD